MTDQSARTPVCIHGGLRRQCEACDLADRLERAEAQRDALLAAARLVVAAFPEWEGPEEDEHSDAARARNESVRAFEATRAAIATVERAL